MLTVLFLGDVVGEPGRNAVIARLPELKEQHDVDFIVVNGENAAGGRGITGKITIDLLRAGVSAVTTGDHVWDQKDILSFIETEPRLLRPVNYPPGAPGSGSIVLETAKGKVGVINVQCRTFMQPILENPFRVMEETVAKMRAETPNIIVDVHGETTSEKIAMGRFLEGNAYSCANRGRTNSSRRHCVLVRCWDVRPGQFDSRPRGRTNYEPVRFEHAGLVSGRRGRSSLAWRARRGGRRERPRPADHTCRRARTSASIGRTRTEDRQRTIAEPGTDVVRLISLENCDRQF